MVVGVGAGPEEENGNLLLIEREVIAGAEDAAVLDEVEAWIELVEHLLKSLAGIGAENEQLRFAVFGRILQTANHVEVEHRRGVLERKEGLDPAIMARAD